LIGCLIFKIKKYSNFKTIYTLRRRWQYFVIANIAWFFLIPAGYVYYYLRGARGDYPMWADSIAIPMFYGQTIVLIMAIFLNIFLIIFVFTPRIETIVFKKVRFKGFQRTSLEIFFLLLILIAILANISFIIDGDFLTLPATIVLTYILLSLRAGKIENIEQKSTIANTAYSALPK